MKNNTIYQTINAAIIIYTLVWIAIIPTKILAKPTFAIKYFDTFNLSQKESLMPNLKGEKAEEYLKENGLYNSLGEAMKAARYSFNWIDTSPLPDNKGAFEADNPNNSYATYIQDESVNLVSQNDDWQIEMKLKGFGYGKDIFKVSSDKPKVQKNKTRIEINKSAIHNPQSKIIEWYENKPEGLEQGWTLNERPNNQITNQPLQLELEIGGNLIPKLSEDKQTLLLNKKDSSGTIRYEKLKAWDANGKDVSTEMKLEGNKLTLLAEENEAIYPLTIDPIFSFVKILSAFDKANEDFFGQAVAIDGDTIVVGADLADAPTLSGQGAAYIFTKNQGGVDNWGFVKKLNSSLTTGVDAFGISVAISKDTIVVGSNDEVLSTILGNAFVFERNQGGSNNWGEVKVISASDVAIGDEFGRSVSIYNDTIVVGSYSDDIGGNSGQGSAYVYSRNQGGVNNWGEVKKLTASDGDDGDTFGTSVAIDKDTIVVGAPCDDIVTDNDRGSAYVFKRNQGGVDNWGQVANLSVTDGEVDDNFGIDVAISNDTIAVGALSGGTSNNNEGAAYVFERNQLGFEAWGFVKKLVASDGVNNDNFGVSVAIDNDTVIVGARDKDNLTGGAYFYSRNLGGADNWGESKKLTHSNPQSDDRFGFSVDICGNTAVVGANRDSLNNDSDREGSALIFRTDNVNWNEVKRQTSSDGTDFDQFGNAVAIYGDTIVIGASNDQINTATFQGSAYIFTRNKDGADVWGQVAKLVASDGQAGDEFGHSVAICGDTVIIGAYKHDIGGSNTDQGAAYIFQRNQGGADSWGEVTKITSISGTTGDEFGVSVSISGDTAIVGANRDEISGQTAQGSAHIFNRNQGGADNWGGVKLLVASDGTGGDQFGTSVGISGDTAIVGSPFKDDGTTSSAGAAYIFERNQGGTADNWGQVKKITDVVPEASANFGQAVAIDNDTVVVGSPKYDDIQTDRGRVTLFGRNTNGADNWGSFRTKSTDNVFVGNTEFGTSVSLDKDQLVVGSPFENIGGNNNQGAAYLFERNKNGAGIFGQFMKLNGTNGAAGDEFGISVAISRNHVVIGSHRTDIPASFTQTNFKSTNSNLAGISQGAAFIFRANPFAPTSAGVNVSGKVLSANGRRGLPRTIVSLTDSSGESKTTRTNQFGYYRFENIKAGETYTITAFSRGYQFQSQVINIGESINNLNIRPITNSRLKNWKIR